MKNPLRIVGNLVGVGCTARHLHDHQFRKWPVPRTEWQWFGRADPATTLRQHAYDPALGA
jgi:hypothetical protein